MESAIHRLCDLFQQLGLPAAPAEVEAFIARHRPLPADTALPDAPIWSPSQAQFLREQLQHDADWSELVDSLSAQLRG